MFACFKSANLLQEKRKRNNQKAYFFTSSYSGFSFYYPFSWATSLPTVFRILQFDSLPGNWTIPER